MGMTVRAGYSKQSPTNQGVQFLFFLCLFLFSPIFKLKPPMFFPGEAKMCSKIENGI